MCMMSLLSVKIAIKSTDINSSILTSHKEHLYVALILQLI